MPPSKDDQETSRSHSLANLFETCINEYSQVLLALGEKDCQVVKLKQISVERVLDGYGRLKVWGEQNKATLSASNRVSLDDTLRRDDALRKNVAQVLNLLIHQIQAALTIASQKSGDITRSEAESTSSFDIDSDSEYSFNSSEDDDALSEPPGSTRRSPKITILMAHMEDQITLLYHIDILLRRPRLSGRYLKSTRENRQASPMEMYDRAHIEEKQRLWIILFNARKDPGERVESEDLTPKSLRAQIYDSWEDEPTVSQNEMEAREKSREKDDSHNIISRLARANTRRREQLTHWKRHPFSKDTQEVASVINEDLHVRLKDLDIERPKSLASTKQSFSDVARSAFDESKTLSGRPRTMYASSVVTGRQSARVPRVPRAAFEEDKVECPFCHAMLDSATMRSRMSWKRHVFRDLRPYICTHDCSNPDKLYATRHDWAYHEMQMHRRQWKCQKCHISFYNKASMANHLRVAHSESVAAQLAIILEMSERPIDDDCLTTCTFCPDQLSLGRLLEHVAQHMEEIALFVLPSLLDDDEDAESNAARLSQDDKGNVQSSGEESLKTLDSSLDFSETDWVERERELQAEREREFQAEREREFQAERERQAQAEREREFQAEREREFQAERERQAQAEGSGSGTPRGTEGSKWKCCNCAHGFFDISLDYVCPNCCVPRCPKCGVCETDSEEDSSIPGTPT